MHIVDNRVTDEASGKPTFELFAHPVPGTQSLFLLEHATSRKEVITTDVYLFFVKEKLNWIIPDVYSHADDYNAVGYKTCAAKPDDGKSYVTLSSLLSPAVFPRPDAHRLDLWVLNEPK